jgi:hypothetical protein
VKARSRRNLVVTRHSGDGPLTEPTAAPQPWPRERNLMPQSRPSWGCSATAESGGKLSFTAPHRGDRVAHASGHSPVPEGDISTKWRPRTSPLGTGMLRC